MQGLYKKGLGRRAKKKAIADDKKKRKSPGVIRVQTDLDELELPGNCKIELPDKQNLQVFHIVIKVDGGYWKGGKYSFKFDIPDNYPYKPPKVTLIEKIYHPNIDLNGNVCLNLLKKDWTAILTVQQVMHGLIFLFLEPNHADPLNLEAAKVLRENESTFANNVKKSLRGGYVLGTQFQKMI
eukprot:464016_1